MYRGSGTAAEIFRWTVLDFAARALCLDPVSALHSTKMKALEHELASVKEDRKRLQEIETKHLTIVNEVRR